MGNNMALERLTLIGQSVVKYSDRGIWVNAIPVGDPVDIIVEVKRRGNIWTPNDEEISKASPEGANAYAMGERRIVIHPGHKYGFTFQYYRIR